MAVKYIVAQYETASIVSDKIFSDNKCLGQSFRFGLGSVTNIDAPLASVPEQFLKYGLVLWRSDDQDFGTAAATPNSMMPWIPETALERNAAADDNAASRSAADTAVRPSG